MAETDFLIALAADAFIYAPLFIAHQARLFEAHVDLAVIRKAPTDRFAPMAFAKDIQGVFEDRDHRPLVIVCDPMHANVYNQTHRKSGTELTVVGTLLKSPACWLFDGLDTKQLIAHIQEQKPLRIKTHPRGMTADTLTRWLLTQNAVAAELIEKLLDPAQHPGGELDYFRDLEEEYVIGHAAVSVDLLTMQQIEKNNPDRGIRYDFSTNPDFQEYLMTALVASRDACSAFGDVIKRILIGINVAFDMMKSDIELCADLLVLHYKNRDASIASERLLGAKRLDPIGEIGDFDEETLRAAFIDRLIKTNAYPAIAFDGQDDLRELLRKTVAAYCNVHEDKLRAEPRLSVKELSDSIDTLIGSRRPTISVSDISKVFSSVVGQSSRERLAHEPVHSQTKKTVDWIEKMAENGVPVYEWLVVGQCACVDGERRRLLMEGVNKLYEHWGAVQNSKSPYTALICSPPRTGKSSFVKDLREEIGRRFGKIGAYIEQDVGECSSPEEFKNRLDGKIEAAASNISVKSPAIVFVDEVNKILGGEYVFNKLLGYLDGAKGKGPYIKLPSGNQVDRVSLFWFFAGAWPTCNDARKQLSRNPRLAGAEPGNGGADFNGRLHNNFDLPGCDNAFEKVAKCLAFIDPTERSRIAAIEAHLVLFLTDVRFSGSADIDLKVKELLKRAGGENTLRLSHTWDESLRRSFERKYDGWLEKLPNTAIRIQWEKRDSVSVGK
ncbi:MAG TPA: AAA family ATPase [Candidatus Angelobacter sp.]|jgi:hypothetical protein|nr:AAA family ATPase [Candidatus Angelobacter sp.]